MASKDTNRLEQNIAMWRASLKSGSEMTDDNLIELESHLLDDIEALTKNGLTESEAFLVAKHRIGHKDELSSEYKKINQWTYFFEQLKPFLLGFLLFQAFEACFYKSMLLFNVGLIELGFYDVNISSTLFMIIWVSIIVLCIWKRAHLKTSVLAIICIICIGIGRWSDYHFFEFNNFIKQYGELTTSIISYNITISYIAIYFSLILLTFLTFFRKRKRIKIIE